MATNKPLDEVKTNSDNVDDTPMIVHTEYYYEGTVRKERQHGPMPVSEWAAYEKEHNL